MGQTAHHYLIFETAGGFCGIAWNDVGHHALPVADKAPTRPSDCCCAACPVPSRAPPRRRWPRPSPP